MVHHLNGLKNQKGKVIGIKCVALSLYKSQQCDVAHFTHKVYIQDGDKLAAYLVIN